MSNEPPCTICNGAKSEHFNEDGSQKTRHAYTVREGDLVTPEQMAKRDQPPGRVTLPAQMSMPPIQLGRLVEVLLEKGMLTSAEALYVATMGPKPQIQQFADPAHSFGVESVGGGS